MGKTGFRESPELVGVFRWWAALRIPLRPECAAFDESAPPRLVSVPRMEEFGPGLKVPRNPSMLAGCDMHERVMRVLSQR